MFLQVLVPLAIVVASLVIITRVVGPLLPDPVLERRLRVIGVIATGFFVAALV